ncbi:MAG: guanylate kinase [Candidatus Dormibacteraeota bacterium]|uniref:Guanylate kinase n=1 Tax=Candidatus Aeolococcus gillhamiae TaxID=3127015 RepID=A0A2W5YZU9_9BACT|nr:guanylate kinase [Candidatus Dormibacteraeota bacterium]PZR78502.1 MAG: guanylate kinase [Candidatus Dormibacter sp. RRmetagenome_bin12]
MARAPRVTTQPGRLIVLSGPSGVGKDTVLHELRKLDASLRYSVSYTTREPRLGEEDGVAYSFIDEDIFRAMAERGEFLEWAEVHGNRYGTSEARVKAALERGEDIVLKIDVQGAAWIRPRVDGAVFIFLLPPSEEELRRRLVARDTEDEASLDLRFRNAVAELADGAAYDHRVVNDDVRRAAGEILDIVRRRRAERRA